MIRLHSKLINEILHLVKDESELITNDILELIYKVLETNVIFYMPEKTVFYKFVDVFLNLIATKHEKIEQVFIVLNDLSNKNKYKNIFSRPIEFITDRFLSEIKQKSVIIFDDLKNIENFTEFFSVNQIQFGKFVLKFGFTSSPFFLYDLYTLPKFEFKPFAPISFEQQTCWYYKRCFDKTVYKTFIKTEEQLRGNYDEKVKETLTSIFRLAINLKKSGKNEEVKAAEKILFLLCNDLYATKYVLDVVLVNKNCTKLVYNIASLPFRSNKLDVVISQLCSTNNKNIVLLLENSNVAEMLFDILKIELSNSYKVINVESNDTLFYFDFITETNVVRRLQIMVFDNFNSKITFDYMIVYDFRPIFVHCHKFYVLPTSKQNLISSLLKFEEKIETEIRNVQETKTHINGENRRETGKHYAIKISSDSVIEKKEFAMQKNYKIADIDSYKNILYVEKGKNFSFVGFDILRHTKYLEFEAVKANYDIVFLNAVSIEFGTVANHNNFLNRYLVKASIFMFFLKEEIAIFCFSKSQNFKFKIPISTLENFIFTEKKEFVLSFYLCLTRKPKVFRSPNLTNIHRKWAGICKMKNDECLNLFESVVWNRCSILEAPFIENRDDLKIVFDLKNNPDYDKIKQKIIRRRIKANENKRNPGNIHNVRLYDVVDFYISLFSRYQNVHLIFSKFSNNLENFLSIDDTVSQFIDLPFDDFYHIMCFITEKQRFIAYNITVEDCEKIKKHNAVNIAYYLLSTIKKRFCNISFLISNFRDYVVNRNNQKIRNVIITPLKIIYKMPVSFESNRILREFDHNKFLRISLRDEDCKSKIKDSAFKDQNHIYDYYRKIMNEGLFLGRKKYFFVAVTASQIKLHNAWFITPYFSNNVLIGSDYIRNWLGDFSEIKNIGKYAMRLGQALSSTIPTIDIDDFLVIDDNKRNGFIFTDGVGAISLKYAKTIANKLGLTEIPSAFQIRFGGYKGVIVAHSLIEEDNEYFGDFGLSEETRLTLINFYKDLQDKENKKVKLDSIYDDNCMYKVLKSNANTFGLILRNSMRKFNSEHKNMEVITFSSTNPCYLNRQIINLLEGLGIKPHVFLEHQDNYVLSILQEMHSEPIKFVKKHCGGVPNGDYVKDLKIFKKILIRRLNKIICELYKKNKMLVKKGSVLMGVVDEFMILRENEVYVKVKKNMVEAYDNFIVDGDYCIVVGPCIVVKNPCLHPGDVRKVFAVNKPELHFLRDVLVFNQVGKRPVSNMCSGSDLDGDMYTVIWEKNLIPQECSEPSLYDNQTFLSKEVVCLKDIVNFYISYIRNYNLGNIAYAHMVSCDLYGVQSENSKLLAELFNKSIDFPKTGFVATVPESLVPSSYPDFLPLHGSIYPSFKTLGLLYRRSLSLNINNEQRCECKNCVKRYIDGLSSFKRNIMLGCNIKFKDMQFEKNITISKTEEDFFCFFKSNLRNILHRHGFNVEEEIWVQYKTDDDDKNYESIIIDVKRLFKEIRNEIKTKNINEKALLIMSESCTETINSLPFLFKANNKYKFEYKDLFERDRFINFIYNSKIRVHKMHVIKGKECALQNKVDILDEDKNLYLRDDTINVYADAAIFSKFTAKINRDFDEIFCEIFNLLFLADFFEARAFDLVCVFFLFLQSKIKSNTRLEVSRALFEISREFYRFPTENPFCYFLCKELSKVKNNFYIVNITNEYTVYKDFSINTEKVKLIIDKLSRTIETVGYLLMFDISFVQKYRSIKKNYKESYYKDLPIQTYIKKSGQGGFVLKGMFDTADELKLELYCGVKHILHKKYKVYTPRLLNKGFCDIQTHKINVKEFFINAYLNCLHSRIQKNTESRCDDETVKIEDCKNTVENICNKQTYLTQSENKSTEANFCPYILTITVLPGKFYFYDLPSSCINETMTIETLCASTQFYKKTPDGDQKKTLKCYFFNNNDLINEECRAKYIKRKSIVFEDKIVHYAFSFVVNNIRYQVYYKLINEKFVVNYITKGRVVAGKVYIINDNESNDGDVLFEEIILKDTYKNLTIHESRIFSEELLVRKKNFYIVSDILKNANNVRFEIDTKIYTNNTLNIELINRQIYTKNSDSLDLKKCYKRLVVSSTTTNERQVIDNVTEFIKMFDKAWDNFTFYYA